MPAALTKAPKASTTTSAARSVRLLNRPRPERSGSVHKSLPGKRENADVVVRAGVDAVEAEGAVHVARLAGLVQVQLAAGDVVSAADAVFGLTGRTHARVAHLDFQGETNDCTKLNWPIGQTYLQKDAPRKKPSMTKAAAK